MKKLSLFPCFYLLVFCYPTVFGQTQKGNFLIGVGSELSFSTKSEKLKSDNGDTDGEKTIRFEFSPRAAYFFMDNFAIGFDVPISYSKEKDEGENESAISSVAFAPFLRYYFNSDNLKPFVYGGVGFGSYKDLYTPVSGDVDELKASMFLYEAGGGLGVFLNQNIALDFVVGYNSSIIKPKEDNPYDLKIVKSGIVFQVGLSVIF